MAIRATISAATIAAAGTLIYFAARARRLTPLRAGTILAISGAASAAILIINELVRSGGAL
jgi:hypothetical protein